MLEALRPVDALISPSLFARQRLMAWGADPGRAHTIENVMSPPVLKSAAVRRQPPRSGPVVVGYFGPVTPFKGIDVLLRAMQSLSEDTREKVHLALYGANLEGQTAEFQEEIRERLADLKDCVTSWARTTTAMFTTS